LEVLRLLGLLIVAAVLAVPLAAASRVAARVLAPIRGPWTTYRLRRVWRDMAAALDLELEGWCLRGTIDGVDLQLRLRGRRILLLARPHAVLPWRLALRSPEEPETALLGPDAPGFERAFAVRGSALEAAAVLDAATRALLGDLLRDAPGSLEICDGSVHYEQSVVTADAQWLASLARTVVHISRHLAGQDRSLPARLLRNATSDPDVSVRLRSLWLLFNHFPGIAASRQAALYLLRHFAAAGGRRGPGSVPDAGFPASFELAEALALRADVRALALRHLSAQLWPEHVRPLVEQSLQDDSPVVQLAAVDVAAELAEPRLLPRLLELAASAEPPLAAAIARSLSRFAGEPAEQGLVRLLARAEPDVQAAAIESLGASGSVRSVEPLLQPPKGLPAELRAARAEAVRRIQARLRDAEPGQLSLAASDDKRGALSASEDAGALSVSDGQSEHEPGAEAC
jgi:hypothetical protein